MGNIFDLTGKVAIVVGGHGGIGKAQALGLADAGADVVVVSRSLDALNKVAAEIKAKGRKSMAVSADVTDENSVKAAVDQILKEFKRIDLLVNAAGINAPQPAATFSIADYRRVIDVNVTGTFIFCKIVGAHMVERKSGSILNLSSVRGQYGLPANYAAYCSSKGAVDTLTKTLACEWAKHNVRVNAIAPTIVETDLTKPMLADPAYAAMMKNSIPMGKWALTSDMVGATVFFLSDASSFITGQVLYIDGGVTTW
jgi:NAD(P)-dependent dehydrogenase (short-subunit alcohol dehydrogenase family)